MARLTIANAKAKVAMLNIAAKKVLNHTIELQRVDKQYRIYRNGESGALVPLSPAYTSLSEFCAMLDGMQFLLLELNNKSN